MSISKAQAQALADGFFDNMGGDKEGLRPRETVTELFLLAGELVEDAQTNLNKSKNNASGALSESLKLNEPIKTGTVVQVDVLMNFYGRFQNKGVKGTKSGSGLYSFKTDMPSKKMVVAIEKWITRAKVSTRTVKKYSGYGGHEIKNKTISQYDSAFAKARSIKMYGFKASGFLDKAIKTTSDKLSDRMGAALKIDIINSIT